LFGAGFLPTAYTTYNTSCRTENSSTRSNNQRLKKQWVSFPYKYNCKLEKSLYVEKENKKFIIEKKHIFSSSMLFY